MKGVDIPQIDDLSTVVDAVRAVQRGSRTPSEVARALDLDERHAGYALAAGRVLGLLHRRGESWVVAERGADLLGRSPNTVDAALRDAVLGSPALRRVVPDLLEPGARPTPESVARAIANHAGLSPATATRRAASLLAWRRRLLHPGLFGEAAPRFVADAARDDLVLRRLTIENFGPLRSVDAELGHCTVIIGRNATGKTTFLDAIAFIADALERGVEDAWRARADTWSDLLWYGRGDAFGVALEIELPGAPGTRSLARYELQIGLISTGGVGVVHEALYLTPPRGGADRAIAHADTPRGWFRVLATGDGRAAFFRSERGDWKTVFQLSPNHLALANVQASEDRFPVALKVRHLLSGGVTVLALSADAMRRPCSPLLTGRLRRNGENLPLRIAALQATDPDQYARWLDQVREALPALAGIDVAEREVDRHRYVVVRYADGLRVPAWRLSDGTLRILALTLLGYLDEDALILVEEPENGIHPRALEAVYEALSAAPRTQVLVATHSPVLLGIVPPADLLCFSHDGGETRIVPGHQHALLRGWRREVDLGTMFASGVLE